MLALKSLGAIRAWFKVLKGIIDAWGLGCRAMLFTVFELGSACSGYLEPLDSGENTKPKI